MNAQTKIKAKKITFTTLKIGEKKGMKRIWIEGNNLLKAGFPKGMRYDVDYQPEHARIVIKKKASGARTVSGRKRKGTDAVCPIIELISKQVGEVAGDAKEVTVDFYDKGIVLRVVVTNE